MRASEFLREGIIGDMYDMNKEMDQAAGPDPVDLAKLLTEKWLGIVKDKVAKAGKGETLELKDELTKIAATMHFSDEDEGNAKVVLGEILNVTADKPKNPNKRKIAELFKKLVSLSSESEGEESEDTGPKREVSGIKDGSIMYVRIDGDAQWTRYDQIRDDTYKLRKATVPDKKAELLNDAPGSLDLKLTQEEDGTTTIEDINKLVTGQDEQGRQYIEGLAIPVALAGGMFVGRKNEDSGEMEWKKYKRMKKGAPIYDYKGPASDERASSLNDVLATKPDSARSVRVTDIADQNQYVTIIPTT